MTQAENEFIINSYFNDNKSTVWIGKQLNKSPKTIRATIIKLGYQLRDKKTAAETSYKNGRVAPQAGKSMSEETKKKIAKSVSQNWSKLSEENYKKRVEKCKETWYNLSVSVREKIYNSSRAALAVTSREGSKLERDTYTFLCENNFAPVMHYKNFPYEKLEVDIFLPANKIAIEIDGPTHFVPLYGDDRLNETIKSDQKKNNLLLGLGYAIIRIGFIKEVTNFQKEEMFNSLKDLLEEINYKFPEEGNRCILLEIK